MKVVSDLVRTKLGIGREITLVDVARLATTRTEVGGVGPVLVTFEHQAAIMEICRNVQNSR